MTIQTCGEKELIELLFQFSFNRDILIEEALDKIIELKKRLYGFQFSFNWDVFRGFNRALGDPEYYRAFNSLLIEIFWLGFLKEIR